MGDATTVLCVFFAMTAISGWRQFTTSKIPNPGRNGSVGIEFIRWPRESPGPPQTASLLGPRASRRLGPFFGKPVRLPRWLRSPAGNSDSQVRAARKACWPADVAKMLLENRAGFRHIV